MLHRFSGNLTSLLASGAARVEDDDTISLLLSPTEAAKGGMATISLHVDLRCPTCASTPATSAAPCPRCHGTGAVDELYAAWLAIPPVSPTAKSSRPPSTSPACSHPCGSRFA